MNNELYSNNDYRYYSLAHHGILGQKWGRKQGPPYPLDVSDHSAAEKKAGYTKSLDRKKNRQIKRINTMYDRSNMWTNKKIAKLEAKGKTAKANVMKVMVKKNEEARKEKIDAINNMTSAKELRKSKMRDLGDAAFGGQMWMKNNAANMTTYFTRLNEYQAQRGMRWMSNFTRESTLKRMSAEEGYEYLRRKQVAGEVAASAYNAGRRLQKEQQRKENIRQTRQRIVDYNPSKKTSDPAMDAWKKASYAKTEAERDEYLKEFDRLLRK